MARLTKRLLDALKPRAETDLFVWDGELKGFGVRMKPSGAASFLVQYRTPQGQTRRFAFAKVGTLTPEEARTKARRLLAEAQGGGDPSAQRREDRKALTVEQLCQAYMEAARAGLVTASSGRAKSRSTLYIDEGRISRHIVPLLGKRVANSVTRADVQRMCDAIASGKTAATIKTKARGVARVTGGAGTATRAAGLLGGIFTWAAKRGLLTGANPVRDLDLRADAAKDRVLTMRELGALGGAMRRASSPVASNALRLIALTGLRKGEAYGMRWREIDAESSCLRLIETKSGRSTRPIGRAAIEHLRILPKLHEEFVFPNRDGSGPADLSKAISAIFDDAGLQDARGHDLRRTLASVAAELGYGTATIGEMLGHAKVGVTERHYIRRPDAALVEAATRTVQLIANALDGVKAEVLKHTAVQGL